MTFISGIVKDYTSGSGVGGARVEVDSTTAAPSQWRKVLTTDAYGKWSTEITGGSEPYSAAATHPLYDNGPGGSNVATNLEPKSTVDYGVILYLSPKYCQIRGKVTDAKSGAPLKNVPIYCDVLKSGNNNVTDDYGNWSWTLSPNPTYTITINYQPSQYTGGDWYEHDVKYIVPTSAGQIYTYDKALTPQRGGVKGTIKDSTTGSPLQGAYVSIEGYAMQPIITGTNGTYAISNVDPREQAINVTKNGYVQQRKTTQAVAGEWATLDFNMSPSAAQPKDTKIYAITSPAEVVINTPFQVSGTLAYLESESGSWKGLDGMIILIRGPFSRNATTTGDGLFVGGDCSISVVGSHTITFTYQGKSDPTAGTWIYEPCSATATIYAKAPVTPPPPPPPTKGKIAGRVTDSSNGLPISTASVYVKEVSETFYPDAFGNYSTRDFTPDSYTLNCLADGYETATKAAVIGAGQTTMVNFQLVKIGGPPPVTQGQVEGHVIDVDTGYGISGAMITVIQNNKQYLTGQGGYYTFTMDEGAYTIEARKDGYRTEVDTVRVIAGQTISLNLEMASAGSYGTIEGTVSDSQTLKPVQSATVTLVGKGLTKTTDEFGKYRFFDLQAGAYDVNAVKAGAYKEKTTSTTVESSKTATVNFNLEPETPVVLPSEIPWWLLPVAAVTIGGVYILTQFSKKKKGVK